MTTEKKKRIYNPVTGHYYKIRNQTNNRRTREIRGLWFDKKKPPVRRG